MEVLDLLMQVHSKSFWKVASDDMPSFRRTAPSLARQLVRRNEPCAVSRYGKRSCRSWWGPTLFRLTFPSVRIERLESNQKMTLLLRGYDSDYYGAAVSVAVAPERRLMQP